ncbi:cell division protein ZapD [Photobacterium japonica]|uniref:cell division protein ZapD n=1 Tax=Photobacterium japonica TaxID=2910235 RepID=UPI003D10710C
MQMNRFEHPLNEKTRIYLRLEFLIRQIKQTSAFSDPWQHQVFFRGLFDLLEVLEQSQLKTELAKDLEKQRTKLKQWLNIDGVDQTALREHLDHLQLAHRHLLATNRLGQDLREDRFLGAIKQRLSIPGGSCCFDLPILHHWLHLPPAQQRVDIQRWLDSIRALNVALTLLLRLIRGAGQTQQCVARGGFFQHEADKANLLRLDICPNHGVYPMISGHRSRFAIRFLPFEEGTSIADTIEFQLTIC